MLLIYFLTAAPNIRQDICNLAPRNTLTPSQKRHKGRNYFGSVKILTDFF